MKNIALSLCTALLLALCLTQPALAGGKKKPAATPTAQASSHGLNPEMVKIPAGIFYMGCEGGAQCNNYEQPRHRVDVPAFEMGKTEVTQGLWKAVMGNNPSEFNTCGDNCPVEQVSWEDIQLFIAELNAQTGKTYRLPSEAEWEYACLAGNNSDTYCGGNSPVGVAWFDINSESKTHPVATKRANAFGLYDMSGNVEEWMQDWYHDNYNGAPTDGSAWKDGGKYRVLRGGPWDGDHQHNRAAYRNYSDPAGRNYDMGFRLARTLP